jgi:hypothetical protein
LRYGQRFGGIEPRFKDYKSGTFDLLRSKIRDAQALSNLLMMVEIAEILAIRLGLLAIEVPTPINPTDKEILDNMRILLICRNIINDRSDSIC